MSSLSYFINKASLLAHLTVGDLEERAELLRSIPGAPQVVYAS